MKKLSAVLLLFAGLFILISCSPGPSDTPSAGSTVASSGASPSGTSRVTITVSAGAGRYAQGASRYNRSAASIPADVVKMVFSIDAEDMTAITRETAVSASEAISEAFDIPNGSARRFEAKAYDSNGTLLFSGETLADLDGSPRDVAIDMQWRQPDSGIYAIGGLITSAGAPYAASGTFGDSSPARGLFPSASADAKGLIQLPAESTFTINIPARFRQAGVLMELHVNYIDGHQAKFSIEDDAGNVVGVSDLQGDADENQTYTWQIDLSPVFTESHTPEYLTLKTVSSLKLNSYIGFYRIETVNDSGVFIADLRPGSSRVITSSARTSHWWSSITAPQNYAKCGEINFSLSDVISSMTKPVLEFNFGREEDDSLRLILYTSNEEVVGQYYSDSDDDEEMGQTFIVDVTGYKDTDTASSFVISADCDTFLNPFVKVYDAAATSGGTVVLDVTPGGANYVSHSGKFGFYLTSNSAEIGRGYQSGGMYDDNIGYEAPHWLADPTHEPYGQEGTLEFSLPDAVKNMQNPVLEIMHFAPDSQPVLASGVPEGINDPEWYPIEFYLLDECGSEIAHVYFGEWEDDAGGVLKNQIPIRAFKDSATMKITVPADDTRWSQAAFPGFIKIFNAIEPPVTVAPAEALSLSPDTVSLTGCGGTGEGRQAVFTAYGGSPPYEWSIDGMGYFDSNYGDDDTKAFWDDSTFNYCYDNATITITVSDSKGATATAAITVTAGD